jgi:ABC-type nickel/cobalt efflux system permease component RcnA
MTPEAKSQALAAAVILGGAILVLYFLPSLVLWIGGYSPVLAVIVGTVLILGFFWIFWLRARYQRQRDGK